MSQTPNLLLTEVAANQSQKEVTINNALVELDGAITSLLVIAMSDANYTLNASEGGEALGNAALQFTGTLSADRNIVLPETPKSYYVQNNTSAGGSPSSTRELVFKTSISSQTVSVSADSTSYAHIYCDGTDVFPVGASGGGSGTLSGDSDVDISSPTNGDVLTYDTGLSRWVNQAPGGGSGGGSWSASTAKRQAIVNLANMVWSSGLTASQTPTNEALGTDPALMGAVFATWVAASATHGGGVTFSDGSNGADYLGGLRTYTPSYASWAMGQNLELWGSMYITGTTNIRFWFGMSASLSGSTPTQFGGNDLPGSGINTSFIGFRYSTVASDTNFQCVCSDGSNDTVVDSGVAADTLSHRFAFVVSDAAPNVKFYIDGNLVATITTHLPASSTVLGYVAGSAYHTSAGSRITLGSIIIQSDF